MDSPPPSFDAIFQQQQQFQHAHQRTTSSSSSNHSFLSNNFSKTFIQGQTMTDEPPAMDGLSRRGSASTHDSEAARQRTTSTSTSSLRHQQQFSDMRQESIPFQSTLINTAQNSAMGNGQGGSLPYQQQPSQQQQSIPPWQQQFPASNTWQGNGGYDQYGLNNMNNQQSPYTGTPNMPSPYQNYENPAGNGYSTSTAGGMDSGGMPMGSSGYGLDQGDGYSQMEDIQHGKKDSMDEGPFGDDAFRAMSGGQDYGNGRGSLGGNGDVRAEDVMEDLLQTLSRSASREPSPAFQPNNHFLQQQHNAMQSLTPDQSMHGHSSAHGSRPTSPFEIIHAPSPSFTAASIPRPGSSPSHQSFITKPRSPPALNMPYPSAPSPVSLPPIVTQQPNQTGDGDQTSQGHALVGQVGGMGGLLPPTNPALQHLGMLGGISPIAPNADGPQIFVQPSTPISGLKDGRGHFDAALRRAAQQSQLATDETQQQQYTVPQPNRGTSGPIPQTQSNQQQNGMDFAAQMAAQNSSAWGDLGNQMHQMRPRSKSDSFAPIGGGVNQGEFERQAMVQIMAQAQAMGLTSAVSQGNGQAQAQVQQAMGYGCGDWRDNVGAWLSSMGISGPAQTQGSPGSAGQMQVPPGTVNPNQLPGNDQTEFLRQLEQQHQLARLQAQRVRAAPLSVNTQTDTSSGIFEYQPGEFSPTSMAFYQQRGMLPPTNQFGFVNSAPFYNTSFQHQNIPPRYDQHQAYQNPSQTNQQSHDQFLAMTPEMMASAAAGRRGSFGGGSQSGAVSGHHATGAGTPGYGMGFADRGQGSFGEGQLSGRNVRSISPGQGHRRAAKSEDLGRGGWGLGHGGSTTEFLNSITANDGSLIPPIRGGRSHSRNSSVSSGRSASPALSVSSHGSSYSYASGSGHGHMEMPDGVELASGSGTAQGTASGSGRRSKLSKMKVTSTATEAAATNRRTNNGIFVCPVPDCGSTFTRHFNLKGHMRSHNDERPYKCLYDGCPKSEIGFARQHDCKRHMLLHQGLRPFECEGCNKKFARLDALTRHHKSEQGTECAIAFPLPTNPDGTPLSESQYKNYKATQGLAVPASTPAGKKGRKRATSFGSDVTGRSGDEGGGGGSGMEDYDRV